jgi:hypothetical protein
MKLDEQHPIIRDAVKKLSFIFNKLLLFIIAGEIVATVVVLFIVFSMHDIVPLIISLVLLSGCIYYLVRDIKLLLKTK